MADLIDNLRGIEISVVRANRALLGTTPVTSANELVRAAADRLEAQEALLREAMAALEEIEARDKLPTPSYGGVTPGQYAYVHRAGPFAEIARATLAKLREHLEGGGTHP